MTLDGLTVVLVDAGRRVSPATVDAIRAVIGAFTTAGREVDQVRLFSVGVSLIEIGLHVEAFAVLERDRGQRDHMAAAVNRINILRPARILVVAGELQELGRPRQESRAYVLMVDAPPSQAYEGWNRLFCDPARIVATIAQVEAAIEPAAPAHA